MVLPIKWLPYLMIIAGVYGVLTGEIDILTSLIIGGIGGGWLYLKNKN